MRSTPWLSPASRRRHAPLRGETRAAVALGALPDALLWDTADPYRYLRLDRRSDADYVIFGGADHKTGQPPTSDSFATLAADLASLTSVAAITHEWSGQVIESSDGLPFIGERADGQFSATGYGGNGMTWGTLAGVMAADWAGGVANPWSELFSWSRSGLSGSVLAGPAERPLGSADGEARDAAPTAAEDAR